MGTPHLNWLYQFYPIFHLYVRLHRFEPMQNTALLESMTFRIFYLAFFVLSSLFNVRHLCVILSAMSRYTTIHAHIWTRAKKKTTNNNMTTHSSTFTLLHWPHWCSPLNIPLVRRVEPDCSPGTSLPVHFFPYFSFLHVCFVSPYCTGDIQTTFGCLV